MNSRQNKKFLIIFFFAALIIRFFLAYVFLNNNAIESWEYDQIAENIVSGKGYSFYYFGAEYKSYSPPLYPIIVSGIYFLFGIKATPVILMQIALSILTCWIVYIIARRVAGGEAALIALGFCLFHPGLIIYSVKKIHAFNLDTLLFSLIILLSLRLKDNPTAKRFAFCGLVFGISALSRPSILPFVPIMILWLFFILRKPFFRKAVDSLLLVLLLILPLSIWAARNYGIHKRLVLTTTNDGEVFWRGNNANATGTSFVDSRTEVLEADKQLYDKLMGLKEIDKRDLFMGEAVKFIKGNPKQFFNLYLKKLYYFWWFSPVSGMFYPQEYLMVYKIFYSIIFVLALCGLISTLSERDKRMRGEIILLVLFILAIWLFQSLFYIEGRHRWALEPILLIFTAKGITYIYDRIKNAWI